MKYLKLISLLFIATIGSLFTSCEETAEVDEYANWEERNVEYINSIAEKAEANTDGKWLKILSFKLDSVDVDGNRVEYGVEDYVYCHVELSGDGAVHPLFTDSVWVNYRGRLMPTDSNPEGEVFDQSYRGEFNPALSVPACFRLNSVVAGWATALMHMVEGDYWRIYVPSHLGYGSTEKNGIPAHSTLIFDVDLVEVSR